MLNMFGLHLLSLMWPKFICAVVITPNYNSRDLLQLLCEHVKEVLAMNNNAVVVMAGDFNQLNYSELEVDLGFSQLVHQNTRGSNILDKFLTNRPDLFSSVTVFDSLVTRRPASADWTARAANFRRDL